MQQVVGANSSFDPRFVFTVCPFLLNSAVSEFNDSDVFVGLFGV